MRSGAGKKKPKPVMYIQYSRILLVFTSERIRPVRPDALHAGGIVQRWYSIPLVYLKLEGYETYYRRMLPPASGGRYAGSSALVTGCARPKPFPLSFPRLSAVYTLSSRRKMSHSTLLNFATRTDYTSGS